MIKIELTIEEYSRLTKIEEKWNKYQTQKMNRAASYKKYRKINPNEKRFRAIMRSAFRKHEGQVHKDAATLRKIILGKLEENERYKFFAILIRYIELLCGVESFNDYCANNDNMNPEVFAQHIVIRGIGLMDKAFKNELNSVLKPEDHALMSKAVFTAQDLQLEQYLPEDYSEKQSEEASS